MLPKRWVVERTFAWLGRCRRLVKDWEYLNANALAFLKFASIRLMIRKKSVIFHEVSGQTLSLLGKSDRQKIRSALTNCSSYYWVGRVRPFMAVSVINTFYSLGGGYAVCEKRRRVVRNAIGCPLHQRYGAGWVHLRYFDFRFQCDRQRSDHV